MQKCLIFMSKLTAPKSAAYVKPKPLKPSKNMQDAKRVGKVPTIRAAFAVLWVWPSYVRNIPVNYALLRGRVVVLGLIVLTPASAQS